MKRLLMYSVFIGAVTLGLTNCTLPSRRGWDDGAVGQLRTEMCVETAGIGCGSSACDCLVDVVVDHFDTPGAFSESKSPPKGFTADAEFCAEDLG